MLTGKSYDAKALAANSNLAADVFIAKPRMSHYLAMSAKIYGIYLKYVSAEDIHVYSVDEVFMDVTGYLRAYGKGVEEMTRDIIRDIHTQTGITATAGIGTISGVWGVGMQGSSKRTDWRPWGISRAAPSGVPTNTTTKIYCTRCSV